MFPTTRLRRLRYHPAVRELVRETRLSPANLILPLFVRPGQNLSEPIAAMPGQCQLSPDMLADEVSQAVELGLGGIILFGIPAKKDATGSDATSDSGIIAQAIHTAKQASRDFLIITDVCCCEYTDHGHCGQLASRPAGSMSRTMQRSNCWPARRWSMPRPGPTWLPPAA